MYLQDLASIREQMPDTIEPGSFVNFAKRQKMSQLITEIYQYQQQPFCIKASASPSMDVTLHAAGGIYSNIPEEPLYFWIERNEGVVWTVSRSWRRQQYYRKHLWSACSRLSHQCIKHIHLISCCCSSDKESIWRNIHPFEFKSFSNKYS